MASGPMTEAAPVVACQLTSTTSSHSGSTGPGGSARVPHGDAHVPFARPGPDHRTPGNDDHQTVSVEVHLLGYLAEPGHLLRDADGLALSTTAQNAGLPRHRPTLVVRQIR